MSKTIVITGASSGIGLASVKHCLNAGHRVIATARKPEDLEMLKSLGAEAIALELSDQDSVNRAAEAILLITNTKIDVLFNNAGYGLQVAMEDTTWHSLQKQHTVNVIGPIQFSNQLLPALKKGSKLVFNTSILGLITIPFRGPYCMSKYALESAADAYRLELEPLGIDVHIIEPGPIEAEFRPNALAELKQVIGNKKTRIDYSGHIERLAQEGNSKGTLPADACAEIFLDIVEERKKRPRYLVTAIAKQAAFAKRLLGSGFHKLAKANEPIRENP